MNKKHLLAVAGAAAALLSLPAAAQDNIYLGAQVGAAKYRDVCEGAASCDDKAGTVGFFVGRQFSRYLSLELALRDSGDARVNDANFKARGAAIDLVSTFPIAGGFTLLARGGLMYATLKGTGAQEHKFGLDYGVGAQYDFTPQFAGRAEWARYPDVGGGDFGKKINVDFFTLGVLYRLR